MVDELRRKLRDAASPERAAVNQGYFKTGPGQYGYGDKFIGVGVPVLRKLAREGETLKPAQIRELLTSAWHEERVLALLILVRQYDRGDDKKRDEIYHLYLRHTRNINNWDLVDCSAPYIVGRHLAARSRAPLRQLAKSSSLWERRIAMLATFHFIRAGEFDDATGIAEMLLDDRQDLIHKAVGWMLREIGQRDAAVLKSFLDRHAPRMPRVMLSYAVEKFAAPERKAYMARRSKARGGKSLGK